jgi:hypothetical protein
VSDAEARGSYAEAAVAAARDEPAVPAHLHHPEDPNAGVVRARLGRGAILAAVLSTAVTVAGFVLLALATRGH